MKRNNKRIESELEHLVQHCEPPTVFNQALPLLGEALECDRIFLYLRSPQQNVGRVPFCWRRSGNIPIVYNEDWNPEPSELAEEDPLFAAALRTEPTRFIENVETADPEVVNYQFEQDNFGHQALIHAHLCHAGQLWGILQPCVFFQPRHWEETDRALIHHAVQWLTQPAVEYVNQSIHQDMTEVIHDH